MSEIPEFIDQEPVFEEKGEMTMLETWIAAFTKPNENTFVEIISQRGATTSKAFLWIFLASLLSSFSSLIAQSFNMKGLGGLRDILPPEFAREIPMSLPSSIGFGTIICGTPIFAIIGIVFFAIGVALTLWSAKLFGGTGSFDKLAYAFSAIAVPSSAISAVLALLGAIPFVGILTGLASFGLSIYVFVLDIFAVKAVNKIDTGKAIGAILLPGILFAVFICCCIVLAALVTGPLLGNVVSEIQQGIY